jgi:acyl carrier protein
MENSENIKEFIVENFLFGDGEKLDNDTDFFEQSIIDSTGILELVCFVEETYGLTVSDDEIVQENFSSINNVASFVEKKQQEVSAQ